MYWLGLSAIAFHASLVLASVGDRLPEFQKCLSHCDELYSCSNPNADHTLLQSVLDSVSPSSYQLEQFEKLGVNPLCRALFSWDCSSDCNYKCQRLVTNSRKNDGHEIVQFYGKWPFVRIWGIQEFASVVFSIGNLMASYRNWPKLNKQFKKHGPGTDAATMYWQYMVLVAVSVVGWTFSTLFHTRDNNITETLDYFGAAGIILANFNAIVVRYFGLFRTRNGRKRLVFQAGLVMVFVLHCWKLYRRWDYQYNMAFGLFFGLSSLALWILHALAVSRVFAKNPHFFNNSIQLLPFETKILSKLEHVGFAESKYIPTLPVYLNLWMVLGMAFELMEFSPIWGLIDAHSMWHFFTIFPSLIWYDWNIWDMELDVVQRKR
ncbi:Protein PER1 [Meyerozyma sp. JA9]|nr:Protein PER1 [Meyerozyma sp. JA9]